MVGGREEKGSFFKNELIFFPSLFLSQPLYFIEPPNQQQKRQADYIKAQLEALKSPSSKKRKNSSDSTALPVPPPSSIVGISFEPISVGVAAKHYGLPQAAVDAVREGCVFSSFFLFLRSRGKERTRGRDRALAREGEGGGVSFALALLSLLPSPLPWETLSLNRFLALLASFFAQQQDPL